MISFILTSRVKDNKDSNIKLLLDSASVCCKPEHIEFLIKYDSDDDQIPKEDFFKQYPFQIKTFSWSRGEGRHSIHNDHLYLFTQHDMRSRFIMICSDDFQFIRPGFDEDILAIQDEFCFIGSQHLAIESCSGRLFQPDILRYWVNNSWSNCLPCATVKTIEVLGNLGYQCNFDNVQTLIVLLMYQEYKINIWKHIHQYYERNPSNGQSGFTKTYNSLEIDGSRWQNIHPYYYDLILQQVKNIYLNIKENEYQTKKNTK